MAVGGQHHTQAASPPGKKPGTRCRRGRVGPRASSDGCRKSRPPLSKINVIAKQLKIKTQLS